jgi:BarA-like signal transduction histidine kinase
MTTENVMTEAGSTSRVGHLLHTHSPDRSNLPLKGYATLLGVFGTTFVGLMVWAKKSNRLIKRTSLTDVMILGVGSHKLARILTKDRITTVMRQPFTVYDGSKDALPAEVTEHVRRDGSPMRQALGELVTCPYCASTWSSTAMLATFLADRQLGRTVATFFSMIAVADVGQKVYHDILAHHVT